MVISKEVRAALEKVIIDYVNSKDKIRQLGGRVGLDLGEVRSKYEASRLIVEKGKEDNDLISIVLEYSRKGLWDKDYFNEARDVLNGPLEKTMKLTIDLDGKLIQVSKYGVRKPISNGNLKSSFHIFLSHSTKDLNAILDIKNELEKYGFLVFVAHKDIMTSATWIDEIERELQNCKIFIAFLTQNFKESDWCDQESGIAYLNNLKIVPINGDGKTNSYGFLNKFQSKSLLFKPKPRTTGEENKFQEDVKRVIVDILLRDDEILRLIKKSAIERLGSIKSYNESDSIFSKFFGLRPFSDDESKSIILTANSNAQIYGAALFNKGVKESLESIISSSSLTIQSLAETKELLNKINARVE
jgi:hypothetical protein